MTSWYNNGHFCLTTSGKYSISRRYLALLPVKRRLIDVDLVCNIVALRKHRFILWLATLGELLTKDRLESMGMVYENKVCVMCTEDSKEDAIHLFLHCTWTKETWLVMRD